MVFIYAILGANILIQYSKLEGGLSDGPVWDTYRRLNYTTISVSLFLLLSMLVWLSTDIINSILGMNMKEITYRIIMEGLSREKYEIYFSYATFHVSSITRDEMNSL